MQLKIEKKSYLHQDHDTYVYTLRNSKTFGSIDLWIFKDKQNSPEAIRLGASFKSEINSFDPRKLGIFGKFLGLAQFNTGWLSLSDSEGAIKTAKEFLKTICTEEQIDESELSHILDENVTFLQKQHLVF